MKILIDAEAIKKLASNTKVFIRGRNLYNAKERIGPPYYDARNHLLSAKVSSFSGHVYDTFLALRSNGSPTAAACSCASFGSFKGSCKHVVGLLLAAQAEELPDDGSTPEALPDDHPLAGVPRLLRPLMTFEDLLRITGPEQTQKRRRGRPAKGEEKTEEAEAEAAAAPRGGFDLFQDNTVVREADQAHAEQEYIRIRPGLSNSEEAGALAHTEDGLPAADSFDRLAAGARFLTHLFSWEEREQNLLRSQAMLNRQEDGLAIEITLELLPGFPHSSQLSLRVGTREHFYVVNSLGAFLSGIRGREAMPFGNYFTWAVSQRMSRPQQLFLDWLEATWLDEVRQQRARDRREPIDSKNLSLSGEHLQTFLNLCAYHGEDLPVLVRLGREDFPLVIRKTLPQGLQAALHEPEAAADKPAESVKFARDEACLVSLAYNGRKLAVGQIADLQSEQLVAEDVLLLHRSGILLFDSVVYFCQSQADRLLWQIMRMLAEKQDHYLALTAAEASFFLGSAHELLRDENKLFWSPVLAKRLIELPLEIKVYIDSLEDAIWLSVFFCYGEYHFRPLIQQSQPQVRKGDPGKALVVRDGQAEFAFENTLKDWGFKEVSLREDQLGMITHGPDGDYMANQFYVRGTEQIFQFVSATIHELRQIAGVFVTPSYKAIELKEPSKVELELKYNEGENLIELILQMDGFSSGDAARIVRAMQLGRPFVRLPDSSLVDLGSAKRLSASGEQMRNLVQTLTGWGAEWQQDRFIIPKYRGLALHGLLQDQNIHTKTDDSPAKQAWERLISDREDPAAAAPAMPPDVNATLRHYQVQGYQWLCFLDRYDMGGILADEMGLGKTLQMLVFLWSLYLREPGPVLVVAPTSLLYNWLQEAKRFVPGLPSTVIEGTKPIRNQQYEELAGKPGLIIVSYGLARQDRRELREFRFSCIVLDEAQNIKNPMTKTSRAVKSLNGKRRFALTGTPLENHIGELWSIFDFIMPGYLFSYSSFQDRFGQVNGQTIQLGDGKAAAAEAETWAPEERGYAEARAAQSGLHQLVSPFIMRRLKQEVLKDLPDKIITDIPCVMTVEQQKLYRKHLALAKRQISDFDGADEKDKGRRRMDILGELTRLRQICCDPSLFMDNYTGGSGKLEALEDLLENLLEGGHRILLFSQFTTMLQIIQKRQRELGRSVLYIDGQVPSKNRLDLVQRFNAGEGDIFLISLKAGGTGLNLTGADVVIHYDPWWNPAVENQATDRAHRMGQRKVVQVFRMVTIGSIEEKIQEMQQAKQALLDDIVSPGATFINRMNLDDIRELFAE